MRNIEPASYKLKNLVMYITLGDLLKPEEVISDMSLFQEEFDIAKKDYEKTVAELFDRYNKQKDILLGEKTADAITDYSILVSHNPKQFLDTYKKLFDLKSNLELKRGDLIGICELERIPSEYTKELFNYFHFSYPQSIQLGNFVVGKVCKEGDVIQKYDNENILSINLCRKAVLYKNGVRLKEIKLMEDDYKFQVCFEKNQPQFSPVYGMNNSIKITSFSFGKQDIINCKSCMPTFPDSIQLEKMFEMI